MGNYCKHGHYEEGSDGACLDEAMGRFGIEAAKQLGYTKAGLDRILEDEGPMAYQEAEGRIDELRDQLMEPWYEKHFLSDEPPCAVRFSDTQTGPLTACTRPEGHRGKHATRARSDA